MGVRRENNRRTAWLLGGVAAGMVAFSFALVPLYGLFCKVVGTTTIGARAGAAPAPPPDVAPQDRWVTVEFDAVVSDGLPWEFRPMQKSMRVRVGERAMVKYLARNLSDRPVEAQAIPAVTPWQVTGYLQKLECFCFNRQVLAPGEAREMPLYFYVSPDLPAEYGSLILSYTFMNTHRLAMRPE